MASAPPVAEVGTLLPSPAWTAWDHPGSHLWPSPDDRAGDLNAVSADRWLDDYAAAARDLLTRLQLPVVIGHGDWYAQNHRWDGDRLKVAYDWDSVIAQPEAAIAGLAAAIWPGTGVTGEVATMSRTQQASTPLVRRGFFLCGASRVEPRDSGHGAGVRSVRSPPVDVPWWTRDSDHASPHGYEGDAPSQ